MIYLQNRKFAETKREFTDSLFTKGGTCDGMMNDINHLFVQVNSPTDDCHGQIGNVFKAFKQGCTVNINGQVNSFTYDELIAI